MPDCGLENKSVAMLVNEKRARDWERQADRQILRERHTDSNPGKGEHKPQTPGQPKLRSKGRQKRPGERGIET